MAIFNLAGYPVEVGKVLAGLCTHTAPHRVLESRHLSAVSMDRLKSVHLPQGAPTSPALSNAVAFQLDRRLSGLAKSVGVSYTRYADDLAFSGGREFSRNANRFAKLVYVIVSEEGFKPNFRKSKLMCSGVRQKIAGVVVNQHPNVTRSTYDELKAIIHRCQIHGVHTRKERELDEHQFRHHLCGRIAALAHLNPAKGGKLLQAFEKIVW